MATIEQQRAVINFTFFCEPTETKTAREVADDTVTLLNNFAKNQSAGSYAQCRQVDLAENQIQLYAQVSIAVANAAEAGPIKTTLVNNIAALPPMADNTLHFMYECRWINEPDPE